jgi:RNA polymerase I-specific transcription initiation factor RRN5
MSSTSEFDDDKHGPSDSSTDEDHTRPTSRAVSRTPHSPRKRRRSSSVDSLRSRKRHLDGKYCDAYRLLYNDAVNAASTRHEDDDAFQPYATTVGVSQWTAGEKSHFFAALARFGRDDLPAIAGAIGSKTILETRQFLLLVQEAYARHTAKGKNARITLEDIPAALEVGIECQDRLELASDALAWYQERFEAKQEQERYGKYWLITPEVADEIEEASGTSVSATVIPDDESEDEKPAKSQVKTIFQVLPAIRGAELLSVGTLLHLSKYYFMNPSPTTSYPWPHWTELVNELAAEPSIYRSAFGDLHTLVVSLTRRLVQTAIVQATGRIRTQGWRTKKGLSPYVKRRDVLTSIDILGLERNGKRRWCGLARRCGLRVEKGVRRVGGKGEKRSIEVTWDEVEQLLESSNIPAEPLSTDADTAGLTSGTDEGVYRARAIRDGTPLPTAHSAPSSDSEYDRPRASRRDSESSISNEYQPPVEEISDMSILDEDAAEVDSSQDMSEGDEEAMEHFDQHARREGERYLLHLLESRTGEDEHAKLKGETGEPDVKKSVMRPDQLPTDDWRDWTQYRASWEELRSPVPPSSFVNRRADERSVPVTSVEQRQSGSDLEIGDRVRSRDDLLIRGARAYAAMQDRTPIVDDGTISSDAGRDDLAQIPTESVEDVEEQDAMDLD